MNRFLNNRAQKLIKRGYLIYSIALLVILAAIAGGTYAWFVDSSLTFDNVFTAGTVEVDLDPDKATVIVALNGCDEYKWHLKNIGTKSSYVRAKIVRTEIEVDGETAWAFGGDEYSDSFIDLGISNKWGWVVYYTVGAPDLTADLYAGAGQNDLSKGTFVGTVTIKTITIAPALEITDDTPAEETSDNETSVDEESEDEIESSDINNEEIIVQDAPAGELFLEVTYNILPGWDMSEAHLFVDTGLPPFPVAPGLFPYKATSGEGNLDSPSSHTFLIPLSDLGSEGTGLVLAAHAVVANGRVDKYMYQPSSLGEDCEQNWFWYKEENEDYGYWYYWQYTDFENQVGTLRKVAAGEELQLCLLICPLGSDNRRYKFYIEIESVQSSHGAVKTIWPEAVWKDLPD